MVDTIEKRVSDLEALLADLPELVNLRLERFDNAVRDNTARFDEMAGRLNLLDKQMGMLLRDMRDLRGGVTRQLVEQDKVIRSLDERVGKLEERVARLESLVAELRSLIEERMGSLETKFGTFEEMLKEILKRLPKR